MTLLARSNINLNIFSGAISFWGLVKTPTSESLQKTIDDVNSICEGPRFVPHLTFCSSPYPASGQGKSNRFNPRDIIARLPEAISCRFRVSPEVHFSDNYTMSCCLILEELGETTTKYKAIGDSIVSMTGGSPYTKPPHISLHYGAIPAASRQTVSRLITQSAPSEVEIYKVAAVTSAPGVIP